MKLKTITRNGRQTRLGRPRQFTCNTDFHRAFTILLAIFLLFALSACTGGANTITDGANGTNPGTETEAVPDAVIPQDAPRVEMLAQAYENNNIVEVPQLVLDETRENQGEINLEILAFAGDYGSYLALPNADEWLELKCYPFYTGDFVCIVLTRALCPATDNYGEIISFVYDYKQDRIYSLEEALIDAGLELTTPEAALLAALPEGIQADSCVSVAFGLTADQSPIFFFDVFLSDSGELSGGRALFIRHSDGSYEAGNGNFIASAFGGGLLALDPPLYWAQNFEG